MPPMTACHVCEAAKVETLLDFGPQTLSNRFLPETQQEALFPFVLGQCAECGMIQIPKPISPVELKARFDWIRYNEQEGHLDDMVSGALKLPGLDKDCTVGAISFKDDSTVGRFQKCGFGRTWRLDLQRDWGIDDPLAGLETIQALLTPDTAVRIAKSRGLADLLIARHVLEHAHEPRKFLEGLRRLVKPGGYIIFEVPDCMPALQRLDYTMFWEEHVLYFTPEIFQRSLRILGFFPVHFQRYVYSNENSLVAIVRSVQGEKEPAPNASPAATVVQEGKRYAESFNDFRRKAADALAEYQHKHGKIAIFGAGHLSCAWVNFLQVERYIEFVVDDHPKKRGLFMPGSHLPIRGSEELLAQDIKLCLLSLSPESEGKVVQKNQAFLERGGRFASIFPGKPNSFAV